MANLDRIARGEIAAGHRAFSLLAAGTGSAAASSRISRRALRAMSTTSWEVGPAVLITGSRLVSLVTISAVTVSVSAGPIVRSRVTMESQPSTEVRVVS